MVKKFFYFGFGSNMLASRIHIQNPTAQRIGAGKLEVSSHIWIEISHCINKALVRRTIAWTFTDSSSEVDGVDRLRQSCPPTVPTYLVPFGR